jgi:hypothetical protein
VQRKILDMFFLGKLHLFIWTREHIFLHVANVTWTKLDPLAFVLHFLNQLWIVARFVCSICGAMAGSLSVTTTAVSSAKVVVVDSGEVGRSAGIIMALGHCFRVCPH